MPIVFITGANKGLGYDTARRLIALGCDVIVGARSPERGSSAANTLGARFVLIDVTDDDSVDRAAADVEAHEGRVDVLINNAGVVGAHGPVDTLTGRDAVDILNTNVAGIVRVTHAFLPLLLRSAHPAVINVSSGMGSFGLTHDPDRIESKVVAPLYTASKAAVTMLTTQYARGLPDIRFSAVDPGYTATDFNNNSGTQSVSEGTDAIVALAMQGADGGSGEFVDRFGTVPW